MRKINPSFVYAVTILGFVSLVYFALATYHYALSGKAALLTHHLLLKSREGIITFNPIAVAKSFVSLMIFPLFLASGLIYAVNRDAKYALLSLFFLIAHIAAESKPLPLISRDTVLPYLPLLVSAAVYLEGTSRLGREQEKHRRAKELEEAIEKMEARHLPLPRLSQIEHLKAHENHFGNRTARQLKTFLVPASKLLVFFSAVLLVLFSQKFFIGGQSSTMEFLLFRHALEVEFNYLVFNALSFLFLLFVFVSFRGVAAMLYNATTVGAYEKDAHVSDEFLRSKKTETPVLDFNFSNFERNSFLAFMLILLVPAALSGDSDAIKKAAVQVISEQPEYEESTYLESLNENLADSSNFFDGLNHFLAFDSGDYITKHAMILVE